jgi:hypothetical protein
MLLSPVVFWTLLEWECVYGALPRDKHLGHNVLWGLVCWLVHCGCAECHLSGFCLCAVVRPQGGRKEDIPLEMYARSMDGMEAKLLKRVNGSNLLM